MNIFKCYKCSEIWIDEDDSYTNDDCGSCGARHVEAIQIGPVEVVHHGEGGHGYYEVGLGLLDKVEATQKISRFSYARKNRALSGRRCRFPAIREIASRKPWTYS